METRTYKVNLRNNYYNALSVGLSQYDTGVQLAFDVYDGEEKAVFDEGTTVSIQGVRPSGVGFNMPCTLNDNVASVITTTDMTGEYGEFPVELRFYGNGLGVDVGTVNFNFAIEKAAHPDGTIDADITRQETFIERLETLEENTVTDPTLSISGRPADAKATGDAVAGLENTLKDYNSYDVLEGIAWPNHNWNGITATWDGEKYTVSGTATANAPLNLYSNTSGFPGGISPGDNLNFEIDATGIIPVIYLIFYANGTWVGQRVVQTNYQTIVPDNATGMLLRFFVANGDTVNGTAVIKATKVASNKQLESMSPIVLPSDTIYRTNIINEYLTKYGVVQLAAGTYKINALSMPDNTILRGCGESTILLVDNNANGIVVGANCTIENLRITSATGHTGSRGTGSGILVQGHYDDAPYKYNTKISNVTIDGFACAGIHGKSTGYWVANSISAVNCKIVNCWSGILLEDFCEFNRFTNCLCYNCYIGAYLYSGNNVLVNCSLSNNTVGLYLNGTDASLSGNNGHGAVIGCTINHSNNNNGYAIIAKGITNGFLIDGCNIWYGKINADTGGEGSAGIMLTNCIFGGGTPEIINWGANALILATCIFKATPTFRGNQTTIKNNCYMFDGTAIT